MKESCSRERPKKRIFESLFGALVLLFNNSVVIKVQARGVEMESGYLGNCISKRVLFRRSFVILWLLNEICLLWSFSSRNGRFLWNFVSSKNVKIIVNFRPSYKCLRGYRK